MVGAPAEDSDITGTADPGTAASTNNNATDAGAVYVFTRSGGVWTQQAYLKASNTGAGDTFGQSLALDGDTLVVGAPLEASDITGTTDPGTAASTNNNLFYAGAAYVFTRSGGVWTQQAYLKASNTGAGDLFGSALALAGDTLVVGATREDSDTTGTTNAGTAASTNNAASNAGSVYVFTRSGSVWTQQAYLKASNTGTGDFFGSTLALAGDTLAVGATREDSDITGTTNAGTAAGTNNNAADAGAAYVFTRSGGVWTQQAYLKASNTGAGDNFGQSLALDGDTLVVGAQAEDSDIIGTANAGTTASTNDNLSGTGAVYVFH